MEVDYAKKVLIAVGLGLLGLAAAVLVWTAGHVLILFFAGSLFAVTLLEASSFVSAVLSIPRRLALALFLLTVVGLLVLAGFFFGPPIMEQADRMARDLPRAFAQIEGFVQNSRLAQALIDELPPPSELVGSLQGMLQRTAGVVSSVAGMLTTALIVLLIGILIAVAPDPYVDAALQLVPPDRREQGRRVLGHASQVLGRWVIGRLASMGLVGGLTWVALMIVGIPLALLLSLLAALLSFVPFFGPILAAVPGVLLGFTSSPMTAVWVAAAYLIVQLVETHLLTPIIQHQAVYIPPAFILVAQLVFGSLFGLIGVVFGTPLAALLMTLFEDLYNRGLLGEEGSLPVDDPPPSATSEDHG